LTFDPFAPTPKGDKNKQNVYGDILNSGDSKPKEKKNFGDDFSAPPVREETRQVPPVNNPTPAAPPVNEPPATTPQREEVKPSKPVSQPEVVASNETAARKRGADRQRPVADRGLLPDISQKTDDSASKKKFPLIVAALIVTALVIGGGVGYGVFYTFTNKSGSAQAQALNNAPVPGVPDGVTGQNVLDAPRLEEATASLEVEAKDFSPQLLFLGEVKNAPNEPLVITNEEGAETPVYTASSETYFVDGDVSTENKQKLIDIANGYLADQGYSKYDPTQSDDVDIFTQSQLFIGGVKTEKDGSLKSYNIIVNTASEDGTTPTSGVYVTFYSSPHIKDGDDDKFKKFITDSTD
jgi:hypothetical protein